MTIYVVPYGHIKMDVPLVAAIRWNGTKMNYVEEQEAKKVGTSNKPRLTMA